MIAAQLIPKAVIIRKHTNYHITGEIKLGGALREWEWRDRGREKERQTVVHIKERLSGKSGSKERKRETEKERESGEGLRESRNREIDR